MKEPPSPELVAKLLSVSSTGTRWRRLRSTGAVILWTVCAVCGASAAYGYGVRLPWVLGDWYCKEHRPVARAA